MLTNKQKGSLFFLRNFWLKYSFSYASWSFLKWSWDGAERVWEWYYWYACASTTAHTASHYPIFIRRQEAKKYIERSKMEWKSKLCLSVRPVVACCWINTLWHISFYHELLDIYIFEYFYMWGWSKSKYLLIMK